MAKQPRELEHAERHPALGVHGVGRQPPRGEREVELNRGVGQARGTAIVACAKMALPVYEYSATQIKQAVVGRGHAGKQQVQHMIKVLLNLDLEVQSDAADALAAAVCHGNTEYGMHSINVAKSARGGRRR